MAHLAAQAPQDRFDNSYSLDFRYLTKDSIVYFWRNNEADSELKSIMFFNHTTIPAPAGALHEQTSVSTSFYLPPASSSLEPVLAARVQWWPKLPQNIPQGELKSFQGGLEGFTKEDLIPLRSAPQTAGTLDEVRGLEMSGINYLITPGPEIGGFVHNLWYVHQGRRIKCAIIKKEDPNYLRIYLSNNATAAHIPGLPSAVMGNLRVDGAPMKLFIAAMYLQVPGNSFFPPFMPWGWVLGPRQ